MDAQTILSIGGASMDISEREMDEHFSKALSQALGDVKNSGPVLVLPPDITRFYSRAGFLTDIANRELGSRLGAVMPALGTHMAMTHEELGRMFPKTPQNKFRIHDWRNDVVELGRLEADWVEKTTEGKVAYD